MVLILSRKHKAESKRRTAHARRSVLRLSGIDEMVLASTKDEDLLTLFPVPSVEIIDDAEMAELEKRVAAMPAPRIHLHLCDEETPDERESTLFYIRGKLGLPRELSPGTAGLYDLSLPDGAA